MILTESLFSSFCKALKRRAILRRSIAGVYLECVSVAIFAIAPIAVDAQTPPAMPTQPESSTSTDLFVMGGSDFDRPGLVPRANYNIGIGHTFGFLKKDPIGDELTFGYTYENAGTHGFLHTNVWRAH